MAFGGMFIALLLNADFPIIVAIVLTLLVGGGIGIITGLLGLAVLGVAGAIAQTADTVFARFSPEEQAIEILQNLFIKRTGADADQVAILVLGLLDFCFHMEYVHPESSDPERPESLLRLAFQGLGTEPLG